MLHKNGEFKVRIFANQVKYEPDEEFLKIIKILKIRVVNENGKFYLYSKSFKKLQSILKGVYLAEYVSNE